MTDYKSISEIVDPDTGEARAPEEEWEIEVLELGLSVDLGDLGGREPYVANARVQVTEPGGETWEGLTRLGL